jgi:hypothetical protein
MKPIPAKIKDKFALKKWCVAHKVNVLHGFRALVPRNGTICQAQIKKMQLKAKIKSTGLFDEDTLAVLYPGRKQEMFRARFVAKVRSEVGVTEWPAGSNRGKVVDLFLKAIGLSGGNAWCAAFVWFCALAAGFLKSWLPPEAGYVPEIVTVARSRKNDHVVAIDLKDAVSGDLLCMDWDHDGKADHVCVCIMRVLGFYRIHTIGGNEGTAGTVINGWKFRPQVEQAVRLVI